MQYVHVHGLDVFREEIGGCWATEALAKLGMFLVETLAVAAPARCCG